MRYYEISSGMRLPVNIEEQSVLDKVGNDRLAKSDLDEREQEIARLMVSKGLLHRVADEDKLYFLANAATDIWRF